MTQDAFDQKAEGLPEKIYEWNVSVLIPDAVYLTLSILTSSSHYFNISIAVLDW